MPSHIRAVLLGHLVGVCSVILTGCAGMPSAAVLLPEAASAASALTGHGLNVEINVMSKNTTCTCKTCGK